MVKARDPRRVREYVALCDREAPTEDQTVWLLRTLDVFDQESLALFWEEAGIGRDGAVTDTSSGKQLRALIETVRRGLTGWRNFKLDGTDVAFVRGAGDLPTDDTLRSIPTAILMELSGEVNMSEAVGGTEAGK